jgi:hypothetical protein
MKKMNSPELGVTGAMFRSNYTPIMQYQSLHQDLNRAYKTDRGIEKGYEQTLQ